MSLPASSTGGAIGVFDSGIGGLSVLRQIREQLPYEQLIYVADQGHVPYGSRSVDEIRTFSWGITRFLLDEGAKIIVVACHTASAASLTFLRERFPKVTVVGMEPAVKPAAGRTQTGKIGVLATPGTFDSARYARLLVQHAGEISVFEDPCMGLVELIERGQFDGREVEGILADAVEPMLATGIDTLVLACTHYPLILPAIRRIVGPDITIIDPSPAVARQVWRMLQRDQLLSAPKVKGSVDVITTGEAANIKPIVSQLLDPVYFVDQVRWDRENDIQLRREEP